MSIVKKSIVLVLGNGFNIDLGWETTYKGFMQSEKHWPFQRTTQGLGAWLNTQSSQENWYDLEAMLRKYSCFEDNCGLDFDNQIDEEQFNLLRIKMGEYILEETKKNIGNRLSMAIDLLYWISQYEKNLKVYSFNYTDFNQLLSALDIEEKISCEYIHGQLSSQTQILGIDDNADVRDGYHFLMKTFQPSYRSHNLLDDMRKAECVIFFGLCMGDIDYPYFKLFFQERSNEELYKKENKKRIICFFTKDEESVQSIKKNLWKMNERNLMKMFCFNELAFFTTKDNKWTSEGEMGDFFYRKVHYAMSLI